MNPELSYLVVTEAWQPIQDLDVLLVAKIEAHTILVGRFIGYKFIYSYDRNVTEIV